MIIGVMVSPAPESDWLMTVPTAPMAQAEAKMRRQVAPTVTTSGEGLKARIMASAQMRAGMEPANIRHTATPAASRAARSALAGRPAPRFCPTRVAEAFPTPKPSTLTVRPMRLATPYPAQASMP